MAKTPVDEWDCTINRADQFMVSKKGAGLWYMISPEELWRLIESQLESGTLKIAWEDGENFLVENEMP